MLIWHLCMCLTNTGAVASLHQNIHITKFVIKRAVASGA